MSSYFIRTILQDNYREAGNVIMLAYRSKTFPVNHTRTCWMLVGRLLEFVGKKTPQVDRH